MLVYFVIIGYVFACNEFCSVACQIFNAEETCYHSCECPVQPKLKTLPSFLQEEFERFKSEFYKSTKCTEESLNQCKILVTYSDFLSCYSESGCKSLVEFKYLTENLPKDLWLISSPQHLISYIQDNTEMSFYRTFDHCQRGCLDEYFKSTSPGFQNFAYSDCVQLCGETLDNDIDENCHNSCATICSSQETFCFKNCLKKKCEIEEGTRKKRHCLGCYKNPQQVMEPPKIFRCPVDDPEFREKLKINQFI